jgi:DNA-binding NarL/FixJ family response regulator
MPRITVQIVEDHRLIRETLSLMLERQDGFELLGKFESAEECIDRAASLQPDIVILDLHLRGMNGTEALPLLLGSSPESKVLIFTAYNNPKEARRLLRMGAAGYITKNSSMEELVIALETLSKGRKFVCEDILGRIESPESAPTPTHRPQLSDREKEIAGMIQAGETSREIADKLNISIRTVEVHRSNIFRKWNIKNTAAMVNMLSIGNIL